jgi:arachidonate 5-lipoxygenase
MNIRLALTGTYLKAMFGLSAYALKRGRATHKNGVGAAGQLEIVQNPSFPEHEFFQPGRVFPVFLRHANLEFDDDAASDIRGAALKLSDELDRSPLDIVMNTGVASAFWSTTVFLDFIKAKMKGKDSLQEYGRKYPAAFVAAVDGLRRGPESFTDLRYHSQICFHFRAHDGRSFYLRYRLIPADGRAESGLPLPRDLANPWDQDRIAGETRPEDYLRCEFRERLQRGPVRYTLQVQLHEAQPEDSEEIFNSGVAWPTEQYPWLDLGAVTLSRLLDDETTERLRFNIANQPPSLGVIRARSFDDYNSIGDLRVRVYRFAQAMRFLRYRRDR